MSLLRRIGQAHLEQDEHTPSAAWPTQQPPTVGLPPSMLPPDLASAPPAGSAWNTTQPPLPMAPVPVPPGSSVQIGRAHV